MLQNEPHIFSGIQRDKSVAQQASESLWDAHNVRFNVNDGNTLLTMTNEQGNRKAKKGKKVNDEIVEDGDVTFGNVDLLGYCVVGKYLTVFTHDKNPNNNNPDSIYRIFKHDNSEYFDQALLYQGDLNFSSEHPLETLGIFENTFIQKVYWTDGLSQPRVINITKDLLLNKTVEQIRESYSSTSFDFIGPLKLEEELLIQKKPSSTSYFRAGVIQYAISYYQKYGQETNLAIISPLQYINFEDRAGEADERVGIEFTITIKNIDTSYDYIRLYSIQRTSLNATPIVRRVVDIDLSKSDNRIISYTDNGYLGETLDNASLLYLGGETITAETFAQKDGTLFFGNVAVIRPYVQEIPSSILDDAKTSVKTIFREGKVKPAKDKDNYKYYNILDGVVEKDNPTTHTSDMYSENLTGFKTGEIYRLGIQFQHITGKWTDPIFIKDYTIQREVEITENNNSTIYKLPQIEEGNNYSTIKIPAISLDLDTTSQSWIPEDYKKVRAVVVFPEYNTRNIIAQGIACPTVYNIGYRERKTVTNQASWFFRPDVTSINTEGDNYSIFNSGEELVIDNNGILKSATSKLDSIIEFRDNHMLLGFGDYGAEIQGVPEDWYQDSNNAWQRRNGRVYDNTDASDIIFKIPINGKTIKTIDEHDWYVWSDEPKGYIQYTVTKKNATNLFCIDRNVITINAPDIEFDNTIDFIRLNTLKLRTVGTARTGETYYNLKSNLNIQTSTGPIGGIDARGPIKEESEMDKSASNSLLCAGPLYEDYLVDDGDNGGIRYKDHSDEVKAKFIIYPWHHSGSLNNDNSYGNYNTVSAKLRTKKLYNLRISLNNEWLPETGNNSIQSLDIKKLGLYSTDQLQGLRLDNDTIYYGNVEMALQWNYQGSDPGLLRKGATGYSYICTIGDIDMMKNTGTWLSNNEVTYGDFGRRGPINRPYIGNNHNKLKSWHSDGIIFGTSSYSFYRRRRPDDLLHPSYGTRDSFYSAIEDDIGDKMSEVCYSSAPISMKYKSSKHIVAWLDDNTLSINPVDGLTIVELYRDDNQTTVFGGTTLDALQNNLWLPAGDPININRDSETNNGKTTVIFKYGDTRYQRYDCLKTYPFTLEDENSIIEIGSFLLESRVNIDGRYDKLRGSKEAFDAMPTNFNLINPVYNQTDNFFSYRILDSDLYKLTQFKTSVMWSLQKQPAALTDTWNKVTMANILDLNGKCGKINKLINVAGKLYSFQDTGISVIAFNDRVQIPTGDNNPIEISNNYKVDGYTYVSDRLGVKNKYSIVEGSAGLYFIDSISSSLYSLGEKLADLSSMKGFDNWFKQRDVDTAWTPNLFKFKCFCDNTKHDIYIVDSDTCLNYSESLGEFASFMSYENTPAMFNIETDFYSIKSKNDNLTLWENHKGNYNQFYDEYKPFDFTFISNANPDVSKIFSNIETRLDIYNKSGNNYTLQHNEFLDYIKVWNEYQDTGEVQLNYEPILPSNTKKKFRIWRVQIPRDNSGNKLDRIHNTWSYIKLGKRNNSSDNAKNSYKMIMYDLISQYYI